MLTQEVRSAEMLLAMPGESYALTLNSLVSFLYSTMVWKIHSQTLLTVSRRCMLDALILMHQSITFAKCCFLQSTSTLICKIKNWHPMPTAANFLVHIYIFLNSKVKENSVRLLTFTAPCSCEPPLPPMSARHSWELITCIIDRTF